MFWFSSLFLTLPGLTSFSGGVPRVWSLLSRGENDFYPKIEGKRAADQLRMMLEIMNP